MVMTEQEMKKAVIKFMWHKHNSLKKFFANREPDAPDYFTLKDEGAVWDFSHEQTTKIIETWQELAVGLLDKIYSAEVLCPFCLAHDNCDDCAYGKNHGICEYSNNDFEKIRHMIDAIPFTSIFDIWGGCSGIQEKLKELLGAGNE